MRVWDIHVKQNHYFYFIANIRQNMLVLANILSKVNDQK